LDYLNYPYLKDTNFYFWGSDTLTNPGTTSQHDKSYKFNPRHFLNYSYPINYQINSSGFRDSEWPTDLRDVIWCVGDSFTAGMGVPFKHTWPSILQYRTGKRCLNLGINGASNQLLKNMCLQILKEHKPSTIVVMWSFFWRRHKDPWELLQYTNSSEEEDYAFFIDCYNKVNTFNEECNIINLMIPPQHHNLKNISQCDPIDKGRDNLHFDYKTAEVYVDHILSKLI